MMTNTYTLWTRRDSDGTWGRAIWGETRELCEKARGLFRDRWTTIILPDGQMPR